jgi:hypothetical protein
MSYKRYNRIIIIIWNLFSGDTVRRIPTQTVHLQGTSTEHLL